MDKKLVKYVRENLAKGFLHDDIIARLEKEGWGEEDITYALEHASEEHKHNMRVWFAVGGFIAFIVLCMIVYFAVLSPTVEKPFIEKPQMSEAPVSGVQAGGAQAPPLELHSIAVPVQVPKQAAPAQQKAAPDAVTPKQLEYALTELGFYKIHPNPFGKTLPEIEVFVTDTRQVFRAVVEKNRVRVTSGKSKAPDLRVEVDRHAIAQIVTASDEKQVKERAAQLFKEREKRGYRGMLVARRTDLLLKGYLSLYNEAKSMVKESEITGSAIADIDLSASQFVGMFTIIVTLWGALILQMVLKNDN